jgi:superfamily I DNA and RNA helicase
MFDKILYRKFQTKVFHFPLCCMKLRTKWNMKLFSSSWQGNIKSQNELVKTFFKAFYPDDNDHDHDNDFWQKFRFRKIEIGREREKKSFIQLPDNTQNYPRIIYSFSLKFTLDKKEIILANCF